MASVAAPPLKSARHTGQRWALLRPIIERLPTMAQVCNLYMGISNRCTKNWLLPTTFPLKLLEFNLSLRDRAFQFLLIYGLLLCGINVIIKGVADPAAMLPTGWSRVLLHRQVHLRQNKTNVADRQSGSWMIKFPSARPPAILHRPPPGRRPPADFPPVRFPPSALLLTASSARVDRFLHINYLRLSISSPVIIYLYVQERYWAVVSKE